MTCSRPTSSITNVGGYRHARTQPRRALYEPDATLIPQPGEVFTGTEAIREALSQILAMKPKFDLQFKKAFQAGDIALLISDWTLSASDPDGNAIEMYGRTAGVARCQPDGSWLFAIDNPYGTEHGFANAPALELSG